MAENRQEGPITTEQLADAATPGARTGTMPEAQREDQRTAQRESEQQTLQPQGDQQTLQGNDPEGHATDALLADNETSAYRVRWEQIQIGFVDRPREAVQQADTLVAEVMRRLAETFADARARLEGEWSRGGDVGTEELRLALQRYRSFFELLLRR